MMTHCMRRTSQRPTPKTPPTALRRRPIPKHCRRCSSAGLPGRGRMSSRKSLHSPTCTWPSGHRLDSQPRRRTWARARSGRRVGATMRRGRLSTASSQILTTTKWVRSRTPTRRCQKSSNERLNAKRTGPKHSGHCGTASGGKASRPSSRPTASRGRSMRAKVGSPKPTLCTWLRAGATYEWFASCSSRERSVASAMATAAPRDSWRSKWTSWVPTRR
mmetsp:Transcript_51447/g.149592  ORF Transcript_51447/g.149592 Transcript_51447/m.149592 type:complete len:218 (-) Transcript_51447:328-981(-)